MTFDLHIGASPLLISMPHVGTDLPPAIERRLSEAARRLPDTDWHLERLYDFTQAYGASVIRARLSRYVVDLNRPPDDADLYPGRNTTGLCPIGTFANQPVYRPGQEPSSDEIAERVETYWRPYHDQLAAALAGIRDQHGHALLWDAHSIRSRVPFLFEGRLPDLNLGTGGGACPPRLAARLEVAAKSVRGYTAVLDGRFTGGHITRHYGAPAVGVVAAQLELAQITYMNERHPFAFSDRKARRLRPVLRTLLDTFAAWSPA